MTGEDEDEDGMSLSLFALKQVLLHKLIPLSISPPVEKRVTLEESSVAVESTRRLIDNRDGGAAQVQGHIQFCDHWPTRDSGRIVNKEEVNLVPETWTPAHILGHEMTDFPFSHFFLLGVMFAGEKVRKCGYL